eukprot:g10838.t1
MKFVLLLISVFLFAVATNGRSLNLRQEKKLARNFMKIKKSIKALKLGSKKGRNTLGVNRCFTHGMKGNYTWDVPYYQSAKNKAVQGNYINVDALGLNKTHTIYKYNCHDPKFSSTELCRNIANTKACTLCFGVSHGKMTKSQLMVGDVYNEKDHGRTGNRSIALTVKCTKRTRSSVPKYTYTVEHVDSQDSKKDRRRRRLLQRANGDCRL